MPAHDTLDKAAPADGPGARAAAARADDLSVDGLGPVLTLERPASARVGAADPGDDRHHDHLSRFTPSMLLSLQRSAGNKAVGTFVQRNVCGCSSCACAKGGDEEDPLFGPAPSGSGVTRLAVQRLSLTDVTGAVLPDWVNDIVVGVPDKARSLADMVSGGAQAMEGQAGGQADQAAAKAHADTEHQAGAAEGTAKADATRAEGEAEQAEGRAHMEEARGEKAAGSLPSVGPAAGPLLNPVLPTIDMDRIEQLVSRIGGLVAPMPDDQLVDDVQKAVRNGTAADGKEGWDCDQAEVMSMVGGVGRAVADAAVRGGKAILGEARYNQLAAFVDRKIRGIQETVKGIRDGVGKAVETVGKAWDKATKPLVDRVDAFMKDLGEQWDTLTKRVSAFMDQAIKGAQIVWDAIDTHVIKPFTGTVERAKKTIEDAVRTGVAALGTWWKNLPDAVKNRILGAAALVAGPAGIALAAAYKAAQALMAHKDKIIAAVRKRVDEAVSSAGGWYQKARKVLEKVVAKVKEKGKELLDKARKGAAKAAQLVEAHTPQWVKDLRTALGNVKKKIAGEVCTDLGEVAGPCAEQFVPDLGANAVEGASHDVTVQASGELAVVIEGVPVKVAGGASVALSRKGKVYTVVVSGEGSLAVTTPPTGGGESGAKVDVELPGALGDAQKAWKGITGKTAPGAPAAPGGPAPAVAPPGGAKAAPPATVPGGAPPAGGAPAPAQSGGTTQDVSAEAGYKGKVEMTYVFDGSQPGADKTCDGVGGMVAMLGGLGVGALLPAPFNAIGGGIQGDYANHLIACSVTLSQYGNAKVDVKNDGIGGLQAAVSGEAGVTVGRERQLDPNTNKPTDEWVDTATIFGSVGASLAADLLLRAEPPLKLGGKVAASGRLSGKLAFNEKQGTITAMSVGGSVTFAVGLSLPAVSDILPEPIATAVSKALEPYLELAAGTVEATASISFENLHVLLGAIDAYVNANGESCTAQGVIDVVTAHFAKEGNLVTSLSVVLKVSKSLAKVSAEASGEGASGKAEISVVENQTIPLYPVAAPLPLPKPAQPVSVPKAAPAPKS